MIVKTNAAQTGAEAQDAKGEFRDTWITKPETFRGRYLNDTLHRNGSTRSTTATPFWWLITPFCLVAEEDAE
jgi:hypothetical protein